MSNKKRRSIKLTEEQLTFLRLECELPRKELTLAFNERFNTDLSVENIKAICLRNGWKTGRTGRFEEGHKPAANAKPKGPNRTTFKKGHRPHTWRPIGTERVTGDGYRQRKITDTGNTVNDYVEVHRLVWEEHNGTIPDGYIVTFRDGNRLNCDINNLMLISRAEHAVINKMGLGGVSPELKEPVLHLAQVKIKRKDRNVEEAPHV